MKLESGKVALITGGNSEIDKACAKLFLSHGATVIITERRDACIRYQLGRIFEEGKGVPIDAERALNHYRCAAVSNRDACYRMGYIYEFGAGQYRSEQGACQRVLSKSGG